MTRNVKPIRQPYLLDTVKAALHQVCFSMAAADEAVYVLRIRGLRAYRKSYPGQVITTINGALVQRGAVVAAAVRHAKAIGTRHPQAVDAITTAIIASFAGRYP